ncbi:hypothetical protein CB1_000155031 [Camelus ferus]|nr:hypothetical protein CB1_000155031 [Camelus ferus]
MGPAGCLFLLPLLLVCGRPVYSSRVVGGQDAAARRWPWQGTTGDIALLRLLSRVTYSSSIMPICLPNVKQKWKVPDFCWVTGWGKLKNEGE